MRPLHWFYLFGALVVSAGTPSAWAAQFCVSNPSELTAALTFSQINNQSNEILIQQGQYNMPSGPSPGQVAVFLTSNLIISGGWTAGCTSRSLDPASTTINGQGVGHWGLRTGASITLQGLRFVNLSFELSEDSQCTGGASKFTVRRVIFDGSPGRALSLSSSCHSVRLENNLVVNSQDLGIFMICDGSMSYQLVNNTVANSTGHSGLAIRPLANNSCLANALGLNRLYNNLIDKVHLDDSTPLAFNNILTQINAFNGGGLFTGSTNNQMIDPQLDGDYRPIEPGSPAINSGTTSIPGGLPAIDITGGARIIGSAPDRGAYESNITNLLTLTVTSNANSGAGSLRAAIDQANATSGLNLIQFDIPGACPRLITLSAPLPDVTDDVIINGFSQPDSGWNTLDFGNNANLCVGLVGSQLVDVPYALRVPPDSSATLKVRGIGFGGFDDGGGLLGEAAIYLQGGSGHEIQGNQFGGPFHATTLAGSSEGIRLMNNAASALIGGSSPGHRNTISGSSFAGVHVIGSVSGSHQIVNNYIGTNPSGVSAVGNLDGIRLVQSADNDVLDNLISGNLRDGVVIVGEQATSNLVAGNRIGGRRGGLFLCGVPPLPACPPTMTNRKGILIDSGAGNNTIGAGGALGAPNTIRHSTQHGIRVLSGQRNRLLSNSLHDNGSVASEHEIDIGGFGLDAIDADCGAVADGLANRGQNRPVLDSALGGVSDQSVVFSGELSSCTHDGGFSSVYRIQIFASDACDGNGAGPGQYFLGDVNVVMAGPVQTDATVAFSGELEHPWLHLGGKYITASATDLLGNTSEFSQCVQVQAPDALFHDRFEQ